RALLEFAIQNMAFLESILIRKRPRIRKSACALRACRLSHDSALSNVRHRAYGGLKSEIAPCPLCAKLHTFIKTVKTRHWKSFSNKPALRCQFDFLEFLFASSNSARSMLFKS